jgi:hypothetical protein
VKNGLELRAQQWHDYWTVWQRPQREAARVQAEFLEKALETERKLEDAKRLRDAAQKERDQEDRRRLLKMLRGQRPRNP